MISLESIQLIQRSIEAVNEMRSALASCPGCDTTKVRADLLEVYRELRSLEEEDRQEVIGANLRAWAHGRRRPARPKR